MCNNRLIHGVSEYKQMTTCTINEDKQCAKIVFPDVVCKNWTLLLHEDVIPLVQSFTQTTNAVYFRYTAVTLDSLWWKQCAAR
jgi:ribosomal protein L32